MLRTQQCDRNTQQNNVQFLPGTATYTVEQVIPELTHCMLEAILVAHAKMLVSPKGHFSTMYFVCLTHEANGQEHMRMSGLSMSGLSMSRSV